MGSTLHGIPKADQLGYFFNVLVLIENIALVCSHSATFCFSYDFTIQSLALNFFFFYKYRKFIQIRHVNCRNVHRQGKRSFSNVSCSSQAFKHGGRPDARKVMIVITDGESHDSPDLNKAVEESEKDNITLYGIAVSLLYVSHTFVLQYICISHQCLKVYLFFGCFFVISQ